MSFIYQQTIKHSFEYKILNKIKSNLEHKIKKDKLVINENIFIGFSYGNYHGINIFYNQRKHEKTAKFIKNILENNKIDIRCFSNLNMEYDIEILLGYADNKKEKEEIKKNIDIICSSIHKAFSIIEKGVYIYS